MSTSLTQLQDAVDQLLHQMVASYYFLNKRHELETLGPKDSIRELKPDEERNPLEPEPIPVEEFKAGLTELARDLVLKEQEIEMLITMLPGLGSDEKTQEQRIKQLDEDLQAAESRRQEAIRKKDAVQSKLDKILRETRRPR